tara:strand:- start:460 stop:648 length:189 start_codon:yes stop_codon:yes gene_type:complete
MEHLLKITKEQEVIPRKYITVENMKFLRQRKTLTFINEWDNCFLITGWITPKKEHKPSKIRL